MEACVENCGYYCVQGMQEAQIGPAGIIANGRALNMIECLLNSNIKAPSTVKS